MYIRRITALRIIYTKSFNISYKKLKKKYKEQEELHNVLLYLESKNSFKNIINDPVAKIYGFERLKHELNMFYSFRLSKVIRLIISPNDNGIELYMIYVSDNHYDDFDIKKVIYDE